MDKCPVCFKADLIVPRPGRIGCPKCDWSIDGVPSADFAAAMGEYRAAVKVVDALRADAVKAQEEAARLQDTILRQRKMLDIQIELVRDAYDFIDGVGYVQKGKISNYE